MSDLKVSTAITRRIGPFLDETNGKDAETSLTIDQADIRLSKGGGDFAQKSAAGGATHDEAGWYFFTFSTTDTETRGSLIVQIHVAGALPVWKEYMVLSLQAYESLYGTTSTGSFLNVNMTEMNASGQRVTDLVAICQFLFANSATLGNVLTDDCVIAQMLAVDGTVADYDDNLHSQEAIGVEAAKIGTIPSLDGAAQTIGAAIGKMADDNGGATFNAEFDSLNKIQTNITTSTPGHEPADAEPGGGEVITGTNTDNDSDVTANDDGIYWQIAATTADGDGFGLSVRQTFTFGTEKAANILRINAKETLVGVVHVWAWNYLAAIPAFEQISDTGSAISGATDKDFSYTLLSRHQQSSDGEVKIRFTSTDTNAAKYLYLDQVIIAYRAIDDTTVEEIADAVASHDVSEHTGHDTFGFRAGLSMIEDYPITISDTASSFTCSSLPATTNYYRYHAIRIHDVTGGRFADSWILSMDNAGVVTLGKALPFTPDTDSELFVMGAIVAPAEVAAVLNDFDPASDDVAVVTLVTTTTTNSDMRGTDGVDTTAMRGTDGVDTTTMRGTDGVDTATMRGTDSANTVVPDVAGTAATLHGVTDGKIDALVTTVGVAGAGLTAIPGGDATEAKQDAMIATLATVALTGADSDTLETLSDQIGGIVGGTGTGARTIAVTVNDGAAVLENATVRFTEGANTYAGPTDASGEISFSLDDATYAVAVSKPGYTFTPTTLVVDGDKTPTYSMTAVSITAPPNAATTTGVMTVYDEEGSVESGVTITVQVIDGPGTAGIGYDSTEWAATSNGSGVVEFAGIILGARYKIWRGTSKPNAEEFTAPTTGTSFDLAEVIGRG